MEHGMETWRGKLARVVERMEECAFPASPPAPEAAVGAFARDVAERFSHALPPAYLDFLRLHNSLEFDGKIIYGIDGEIAGEAREYRGFLSANDILRIDLGIDDLVLFGETDMDCYAYSKGEDVYYCLDRGVLDTAYPFERFGVFEEMLSALLDRMLE